MGCSDAPHPFTLQYTYCLWYTKIYIRNLSTLLSQKFCNNINVYSCHIRDLLNRKTICK